MVSKEARKRLENIGALVVVGSGKGGVGKSTVSVNLAIALAKQGASVGLLDGDAYGPSIPLMLGVRKRTESKGWSAALPLGDLKTQQRKIQPLTRYGVKIISVGFFIGEEQAVAPMPDALGLLMRQLLFSVDWGELDYLVIDLPPGTSEPQDTFCRELVVDGAVLVTTPQDIARIDTAKALAMFQRAHVPVLGVVHNMGSVLCPHCGELFEVFPRSTEQRNALDSIPILGDIPLDPGVVSMSDQGYPVVVSMPESAAARVFSEMAQKVTQRLAEEREGEA